MFAYNPSVNDNSGQILAAGQVGAAQANAQMMGQVGQDIGGALANLGGMYAQNKGLQAEAAGYDRIGEILGGSMFKDNPSVGGFLADLRKQKNPQMKIAGYNALFNVAGAISNSQMASSRIEQAPELQQLRDTAATNRMYDAEQLRREREMLKTPAAPNPLSVPTAMRRFNNKPTP